jgi:hypothetical protein
MKLEFIDGDYTYEFRFLKALTYNNKITDFVEITVIEPGKYGCSLWSHMIKDNKLVLRADHNEQVFKLTDNAINYINKLIKLKAFL